MTSLQRKRSVASARFLATQLHEFFLSLSGVVRRCQHRPEANVLKAPTAKMPDDKGLLLVNNIGQATAHASSLRRESTPHAGLKTLTNQLFEQGA